MKMKKTTEIIQLSLTKCFILFTGLSLYIYTCILKKENNLKRNPTQYLFKNHKKNLPNFLNTFSNWLWDEIIHKVNTFGCPQARLERELFPQHFDQDH